MRIWLNPDKLTDYNLTIDEVIAGLRPITWRYRPASSARFPLSKASV